MENIRWGFHGYHCELPPLEKRLFGARPTSLEISTDKTILRLHLVRQPFLDLIAVGDCCSSSWFEHISGVTQFLEQRITSWEDVSMPQVGWSGDFESLIRVYGIKLHTTGGSLFLEFRNSSNGYYGGNIDAYNDDVQARWLLKQSGAQMQPLAVDF